MLNYLYDFFIHIGYAALDHRMILVVGFVILIGMFFSSVSDNRAEVNGLIGRLGFKGFTFGLMLIFLTLSALTAAIFGN